MDNLDELKTIYEDLKKESLKDQEKNQEIDLENNNTLSENDINTINEFLKDSGNVQDLNNFISAFNMQDLINSKYYQKNKGFHYFEDFISFKNIKFKCHKDLKNDNDFLKHFSSIDLIPNKNQIQELLNDSSLNKSNNKKQTQNDSKSIELDESDDKNKIFNSDEDLNTSQKQFNLDSEINLSPKKQSKETKDNLLFEKFEMTNEISYKYKTIDFIKYALYYSFLEKEIAIPGLVGTQLSYDLLKQSRTANLTVSKERVKFDLVIKNMSKEDMKIFFNNIKNNVFQKEKLDLDSKSNHNYDLLIGVINNYFCLSQENCDQINAYIFIIKILNYLRDINKEDENYFANKKLNNIICNKLKINEDNEKILILITNGSYHLLSQIIQFSNKNKFVNIKIEESKKEEIDNDDLDKINYKILSDLIKDTSISKIFSFMQNNRNITNLNKFLNILSILDKSYLKYSIIYFEDDIKMSMENYILNEIMFLEKYNPAELKRFHENYKIILETIQKSDYTNIKNLAFKKEMNYFINLLTTTKSEIKRAFNDYYNSLSENRNIKNIAEKINLDMEKYSFFKNHRVKIYLAKNHSATQKIIDGLKDIFNCDIKLLDTDINNYINYLAEIGRTIEILLGDIIKDYLAINFCDDIYFTNNDFLKTKNILQVIQFNFNKYFNDKYIIDKNIDISGLNYDPSIKNDFEFYEKMSQLLDVILEKFKKLYGKNITKKEEIIYSLINNCKCKYIYFLVFNHIDYRGFSLNRISFSNKILNIFKII